MQQFLMVFYVLFFSTGFMGGAALFLLSLRVRSRVLSWLLLFQISFLLGTGLILYYFYRIEDGGEIPWAVTVLIPAVLMMINVIIWLTIVVIAHRLAPQRRGTPRWRNPVAATHLFAALVIAKSVANSVVLATGSGIAGPLWHLSSHMLTLFAMVAFGVVLRGPINPAEPPAIRPLLRRYGALAILFAPAGLLEWAVQYSALPGLPMLSLDHFLYFAWNLVSMSVAIRLFKPKSDEGATLETVPHERVSALGLSAREVEVASLIARGLTNKEIAENLGISPATVRTHVYNLYQKVGAGSRVELLNMLGS